MLPPRKIWEWLISYVSTLIFKLKFYTLCRDVCGHSNRQYIESSWYETIDFVYFMHRNFKILYTRYRFTSHTIYCKVLAVECCHVRRLLICYIHYFHQMISMIYMLCLTLYLPKHLQSKCIYPTEIRILH